MKRFISRGYTLPEVMFASVIIVFVFLVVLRVYIMGEKLYKGGSSQAHVLMDADVVVEKITRHIRAANKVEIYDNYGSSPTSATQGNYIKIYTSSGNVGYYLSNGRINFIQNLSIDITSSEADDRELANNVVGSNIFNGSGGVISISFSVKDNYTLDGYQGIDLSAKAEPRND